MNLLAVFLCIGVIITIVPESKQAFLWHKPAQPQPNPGKIIHFIVRGTPAAGSTVTSADSDETTAGETSADTSTAAGGDETTTDAVTGGTTASDAGGSSGGADTTTVGVSESTAGASESTASEATPSTAG